MHLGVVRTDDGDEPIKAKARVAARVDFVSFHGCSMYSEQNANADKHRMVRFLAHGRFAVASLYGLAVYNAPLAYISRQGVGRSWQGSASRPRPDQT